ncbi:hypothetical protein QUF99_06655 [Bacillus sp. DX4.1]|uniref:hypothetical protein n=1 Tax=Bacillus sp. DX4.1 TaxID=3055867 RepID=UPI0025A2F6C0|nr:hypothetical protein [Bacillus sp. DX4.1]MDM5187032.1 hypothetical protein [Bacillus sp. DX4.1]
MKAIIEEIYSPCTGKVEEVLVDESSYVYEWEKLVIVRKNDGTLKKIAVGISGHIRSVNIDVGQEVNVNTMLCSLEDDRVITGCE